MICRAAVTGSLVPVHSDTIPLPVPKQYSTIKR